MTIDLSPAALLLASFIFALRVFNYSVGTLRLVFISRGMRLLAASTAFIEALVFAVVITSVVTDLSNVTNLLAYCMGAAVGSYLGMVLESRLLTSYSTVTIIAREKGNEIAEVLRKHNYGATITRGEGREGEVAMIRSSTVNRDIPFMIDIVSEINPDAFIEVESARAIRRGWIPGGPPSRQ